MPTIQIITQTGSTQGDAIFTGTYGLKNQDTGKFEFDPTLRGIYLLDILSTEGVEQDKNNPIADPKLKTLEVSDDALDGLRANLISGLGERWSNMYSGVIASYEGLARTAILAEKSTVARAVSTAIEKLGFKDVNREIVEAKVSFENVPLSYDDNYNYADEPIIGLGSDMAGHMKVSALSSADVVEELTPLNELAVNNIPNGMNFMHGEASLRLSLYAAQGTANELADLLINLPVETNNVVLSAYFVGQPTFSVNPKTTEFQAKTQIADPVSGLATDDPDAPEVEAPVA